VTTQSPRAVRVVAVVTRGCGHRRSKTWPGHRCDRPGVSRSRTQRTSRSSNAARPSRWFRSAPVCPRAGGLRDA
jgi:hypothetical protein